MLRSLGLERAGLGTAVGADVGLDAGEQRVGGRVDGVVVRDVLVCPQHELHLARVLAPGGEEAVVGEGGGACRRRAGRPARARRSSPTAPGDGWRRKRCTSRPAASARSTARWPAGIRVRPKSEMRSGRVTSEGSACSRSHACSSRSAGLGSSSRCRRRLQSSACHAASSGEVDLTASPAAHHLRAVEGVAVEQLGEVAEGGEPASAPVGVVGVAEVDPQVAQPRLVEALADDLEQRPHRALPATTGRRRGRSRTPWRRRHRRGDAGRGTRRSRTRRQLGRASRRGWRRGAA